VGIPGNSADLRSGARPLLILAFNQLDNLLGQVLETVLKRIGRDDLVKPSMDEADFGLRLRFLDLPKHSSEGRGTAAVPVDAMKRIAGERNTVAHGRFGQNPFDGSYRLIGRGRRREAASGGLVALSARCFERIDQVHAPAVKVLDVADEKKDRRRACQ
jgi:hypothetical protein